MSRKLPAIAAVRAAKKEPQPKKSDPLAQYLGKLGGSVRSEAKKKAAKERWAKRRAEFEKHSKPWVEAPGP